MRLAAVVGGGLLALWACGPRIQPAEGLLADSPSPRSEAEAPRARMVEIRTYSLVPGSREEFHRLVVEESLPLLERWDVDVVGYGPSSHDESSYFLIRAFESLDARRMSEDAFYASAEWREGPRERILALIESYATVVLELDAAAVDALRVTATP